MWLFTPIGFFSVVQKVGDDDLTVRSRVYADLNSLRQQFLPSLSAVIATPDADYAFRGKVSHRDFAEALASMAMAIDYDNFKDEVARKQGDERAVHYAEVWSDVRRLQEKTPLTDAMPLFDLAPVTTVANADLIEWRKHSDLLRLASTVFAAVASTRPCNCGECSHCQELTRLGVEINAVSVNASASAVPIKVTSPTKTTAKPPQNASIQS